MNTCPDLKLLIAWTVEHYGVIAECVEWVNWEQGPGGWAACAKIDGHTYQFLIRNGEGGGQLIRQFVEQLPRKAASSNADPARNNKQPVVIRLSERTKHIDKGVKNANVR